MDADLLALAEQIEVAEGPSRELDYAIYDALGRPTVTIPSGTTFTNGETTWAPLYSASLDAALTAVPEWLAVNMGTDGTLGCWAHIWWDTTDYDGCPHKGFGASLALALTAAALRAHIQASPYIGGEG